MQTTKLGGTASDVVVGKIAHGLMMMTWRSPPVSDEDAFEAIIAGISTLPEGAKMLLNSAEFYGQGFSTANLELLARFYEKYPQYVDKTFLAVKGAINETRTGHDCSPKNLRRSIDNINATLRGTKRVDVFEPSRIDRKVSVEDMVNSLVELLKEGKFDHIGLSEVRAETLRRAHKIYPISLVEIEVSPWSYEEETKKVIAAAKELDVAVTAYSPLGRGFLTGTIKKRSDIPEGDMRLNFARFTDENIAKNLAIVDGLKAIAERKGITPAQLSIAWVASLGDKVIPLPGSANKKRTLENAKASEVKLTEKDIADVHEVIAAHPVVGHRYMGEAIDVGLWG